MAQAKTLPAAPPQNQPIPVTQSLEQPSIRLYLLLVLGNILFATIAYYVPALTTIHALGCFTVGVILILRRSPIERVLYVMGYMVGAEIFWRMTEAAVFWEFGKYALSALAVLAILQYRFMRLPVLPLLYFALLSPSILTTFTVGSRPTQQVSSYMSGPLTLMLVSVFISNIKVDFEKLRWLWAAMMGATCLIATTALLGIVTATEIRFSTESNFATSGGFGPNQVSAALGMGALSAILLLLNHRLTPLQRLFVGATGLWLLAQAIVTFSRGGVVGTLVALSPLIIYAIFRQQRQLRVLLAGAVIMAVAIIPAIDAWTGGKLLERYQEVSLTARESIIEKELRLFGLNPLFGIGVGMVRTSSTDSEDEIDNTTSHTEYTRMLAEHGLLGGIALICLAAMAIINLRKHETHGFEFITFLAISLWVAGTMFHSAMRFSGPAFFFALTFLQVAHTPLAETPKVVQPPMILPKTPNARVIR